MEEEAKVPLEQAAAEEGKIKITKHTIVAITPAFKESLLSYLESRPYKEVGDLVNHIKPLKPFEITVNG